MGCKVSSIGWGSIDDAVESHKAKDALVFQETADTLVHDRSVVLDAVKKDALAIELADESFHDDKEIIMTDVAENGLLLKSASVRLRRDKDVALAAVTQFGQALQYADDDLRRNKDVVLAAVSQDGLALEHAHLDCAGSIDIAFKAVKQNPRALQFVDPDLQKDPLFIRPVLKEDGMMLEYLVDHEHIGGPKSWGTALWKEYCMLAVTQNGMALEYAGPIIQADHHAVAVAVSQNSQALAFVAEELQFEAADLLHIAPEDWLKEQGVPVWEPTQIFIQPTVIGGHVIRSREELLAELQPALEPIIVAAGMTWDSCLPCMRVVSSTKRLEEAVDDPQAYFDEQLNLRKTNPQQYFRQFLSSKQGASPS